MPTISGGATIFALNRQRTPRDAEQSSSSESTSGDFSLSMFVECSLGLQLGLRLWQLPEPPAEAQVAWRIPHLASRTIDSI